VTEVTNFSLFQQPSAKQPSTGSVFEPLCFRMPSGRSASDRSHRLLSLPATFRKAAIHRWDSRTSAKTSACIANRIVSGNPKVPRFHPMPRAASHASTARAAWYALPCGCLQLGLPEKPGCIPNSFSRLPEGNGCRSVSFQRKNPAGNRFLPPIPGPLQAGFRVSVSNSGPRLALRPWNGVVLPSFGPLQAGFRASVSNSGPRPAHPGTMPSADSLPPASRFQSFGFVLRAVTDPAFETLQPADPKTGRLNRATTTNRLTGNPRLRS
jgi:hypothetical protein